MSRVKIYEQLFTKVHELVNTRVNDDRDKDWISQYQHMSIDPKLLNLAIPYSVYSRFNFGNVIINSIDWLGKIFMQNAYKEVRPMFFPAIYNTGVGLSNKLNLIERQALLWSNPKLTNPDIIPRFYDLADFSGKVY